MRNFLVSVGFVAILLGLGYFYLLPGSEALLENRQDVVLSDGTDAASLPGAYDQLLRVWKSNPGRLLYGAVYINSTEPDNAWAYATPWNERWIVVLTSYFFTVEQLSTAFTFALLLLNGLAMYALARYCRWSVGLSSALGIVWAFNCYTRARAKVHMALAGIYHLPLIFLGLLLVVRGKGWKSLVGAMVAFLIAGTVAHYYIFTCMFLSPFFLAFVFIQPEFKERRRQILRRLAVAVVPVLIFLAGNYLFILPKDSPIAGESILKAGIAKEGEQDNFILYLKVFHAKALDFFAGDIALHNSPEDLNPLRELVNASILNDLGMSNSHERTNGVRWSLWLFAIAGVVCVLVPKLRRVVGNQGYSANVIFFMCFGLFTFWMALSPDVLFENSGPSYWLFSIFKKIRVTSRAGIQVHFALVMLAGLYLSRLQFGRRWIHLPGVLATLMVLDYYPVQAMPTARVYPAYTDLGRDTGECGVGLAFPYVNPNFYAPVQGYYLMQRLRGSDCPSLNFTSTMSRSRWLAELFPPTDEFLASLTTSQVAQNQLLTLAHCVPLNWIAFHQAVPTDWARAVCGTLGWTLTSDGLCLPPKRTRLLVRYPEQCTLPQ